MLDLGQLQQQINALDKGDDAAQRQAIHGLKHVEQQDWAAAPLAVFHAAIGSLQHQLVNGAKPPLVHKEIAAILGNMGPRSKAAVPQLVEMLKEGIPDCVRETAAVSLGKVGSDARAGVDALVELIDGNNALAVHAVRALGNIGCADQRVRSVLVKLWQSPAQSQNSQIQVAMALCKLKIDAKGLLSFLTNLLVASQDDTLRKSATEALAGCNKNDLDVVPALVTASLGDKNETVRIAAQAALDLLRLTPEKAVQICAKQLKDSVYAEGALRKSGQLAVPALIDALGVDDPGTRVKAARILAGLGELAATAVPALTKALNDKDSEIRLSAAKSLWNVNKNADAVVGVLVDLLAAKRPADQDDGEGRRRFLQTTIEALWRIGPPAKAAVPALMQMAKDKNRLISESARNALSKIAPSAVK